MTGSRIGRVRTVYDELNSRNRVRAPLRLVSTGQLQLSCTQRRRARANSLYLARYSSALTADGVRFDAATTAEALSALETIRLQGNTRIRCRAPLSVLSPATMRKLGRAVIRAYSARNIPPPLTTQIVNAYTVGCARSEGYRPRKRKVFSLEQVRKMLCSLRSDVTRELRMKAIIGLTWITAAYPIEVCALRRRDITLNVDGSVTIERLNAIGHASAEMLTFRVPTTGDGPSGTSACIATTLTKWMHVSNAAPDDALFPLLRKARGDLYVNCVAPAVKEAMRRVGLTDQGFSAMSLRLGYIVHCHGVGVSVYHLLMATGYKTVSALQNATRDLIIWDKSGSWL